MDDLLVRGTRYPKFGPGQTQKPSESSAAQLQSLSRINTRLDENAWPLPRTSASPRQEHQRNVRHQLHNNEFEAPCLRSRTQTSTAREASSQRDRADSNTRLRSPRTEDRRGYRPPLGSRRDQRSVPRATAVARESTEQTMISYDLHPRHNMMPHDSPRSDNIERAQIIVDPVQRIVKASRSRAPLLRTDIVQGNHQCRVQPVLVNPTGPLWTVNSPESSPDQSVDNDERTHRDEHVGQLTPVEVVDVRKSIREMRSPVIKTFRKKITSSDVLLRRPLSLSGETCPGSSIKSTAHMGQSADSPIEKNIGRVDLDNKRDSSILNATMFDSPNSPQSLTSNKSGPWRDILDWSSDASVDEGDLHEVTANRSSTKSWERSELPQSIPGLSQEQCYDTFIPSPTRSNCQSSRQDAPDSEASSPCEEQFPEPTRIRDQSIASSETSKREPSKSETSISSLEKSRRPELDEDPGLTRASNHSEPGSLQTAASFLLPEVRFRPWATADQSYFPDSPTYGDVPCASPQEDVVSRDASVDPGFDFGLSTETQMRSPDVNVDTQEIFDIHSLYPSSDSGTEDVPVVTEFPRALISEESRVRRADSERPESLTLSICESLSIYSVCSMDSSSAADVIPANLRNDESDAPPTRLPQSKATVQVVKHGNILDIAPITRNHQLNIPRQQVSREVSLVITSEDAIGIVPYRGVFPQIDQDFDTIDSPVLPPVSSAKLSVTTEDLAREWLRHRSTVPSQPGTPGYSSFQHNDLDDIFGFESAIDGLKRKKIRKSQIGAPVLISSSTEIPAAEILATKTPSRTEKFKSMFSTKKVNEAIKRNPSDFALPSRAYTDTTLQSTR